MVEHVEHQGNLEPQSAAPDTVDAQSAAPDTVDAQSAPPNTVGAQSEWLESRTQLGAYPEQESTLTVKPELQAKGLDAAGVEVKDARLRGLREARVQVIAEIDGLALRAGVRAVQDDETPADLNRVDLGMDLGPVTASIALPPATRHPFSSGRRGWDAGVYIGFESRSPSRQFYFDFNSRWRSCF